MKEVSVIIPNYNHAPFLQRRIESVLQQTWSHFEVIIMDDCSTDNSREIIEEYRGHPRISSIILNEKNSGSPFIQWEKGFDLVKGDIIWIAESDDYAELNFLEKLVPLFKNNIGLVYCDSNVVDPDNVLHLDFYKKFRNQRFNTEKWNKDYQNNGIVELRENLFFECTINNMSATLFKKDLLKGVNINFLKSFKYCGDWFFLVNLASITSVAYKHDALNYFKYGTDNFKKGTKSALNYFKERAMVRYFFWHKLQASFTPEERATLLKGLGSDLQIQINESLKGKTSFKGTLSMMKDLKKINAGFFKAHLMAALRRYLWRS